jgi:hypothetical protein
VLADAGGGAGIEIGLAKGEEVALCPEIERRAARLFSEGDSPLSRSSIRGGMPIWRKWMWIPTLVAGGSALV